MRLVLIEKRKQGGPWWFCCTSDRDVEMGGKLVFDHVGRDSWAQWDIRVVTVESAREDYGVKVP